MKALIVDDDNINKKYLEEVLSPYAECHLASNGSEGLETFRKEFDQGAPFDLVLMDIMMPGMDGHQAVESIRHFETGNNIPEADQVKVIMISSLDDPKNVSRAFFQGQATSYLTKPFHHEVLIEELNKLKLLD